MIILIPETRGVLPKRVETELRTRLNDATVGVIRDDSGALRCKKATPWTDAQRAEAVTAAGVVPIADEIDRESLLLQGLAEVCRVEINAVRVSAGLTTTNAAQWRQKIRAAARG